MRHGARGQRGRGVSTGSPRSTGSPKQVILGLLGRNRPRDHVSLFSDSQVPRPRHPPAFRSFSNDSAMTLGETGPQLPTWGGAERPGLPGNGHRVALPHKRSVSFILNYLNFIFMTSAVLFFVH